MEHRNSNRLSLLGMMGALFVFVPLLFAGCSASSVDEKTHDDQVYHLQQEVEYFEELMAFSAKWEKIYNQDIERYQGIVEDYESELGPDAEAVSAYQAIIDEVVSFRDWHTDAIERWQVRIGEIQAEIEILEAEGVD